MWGQTVQEVLLTTLRMHRSLTTDDALETTEVAEEPALDCQRAQDCRVAATTAFFKLDANNRIARASAARSVVGCRFWCIVRMGRRVADNVRALLVVVLVSGSTGGTVV